ncbi:hypothetical protein [Thiolapillus sp.]
MFADFEAADFEDMKQEFAQIGRADLVPQLDQLHRMAEVIWQLESLAEAYSEQIFDRLTPAELEKLDPAPSPP